MLLLKNPQFLPYHYEILTKEGTHEDLILTKFRNDRNLTYHYAVEK